MTKMIVALLAAAATAVAQQAPASSPPFDPVFIRTPQGVEGNGARFLVGDRCVTVTAWHVIKGTSAPQIIPIRSQADDGLVEQRAEKLDVGLVVQNGGTRRSCAQLPSSDQIDRALLSASRREVWQINPAGEALPFRVELNRYNGTSLKLEVATGSRDPQAVRAFNPGMSGALVVFDGVPVAVLQSTETETPIADAVRLDFVVRQFPAIFAQPAQTPMTAPIPARVFEPYDLAQLPSEYRDIAKAARDAKKQAIGAAGEADGVARKAEDAAALAKSLPRDSVQGGRAHFDADNGNYYAGEVFWVGTLYGSAGYGISERLSGTSAGNRYICRFVRNLGCNGPGTIYYSQNKDNEGSKLRRWRGMLRDGELSGYGILDWQTGGQAWLNWDSENSRPGVWRESDGRLFEGEIKKNWNGRGVLWDADGRVISIGVWKDGKVVRDDNSKLIR